jgi:putative transposase
MDARHDPSMGLRLIYQMLSTLLGWIVVRARSETSKEIEILVLRHQLALLQRRTPRPPMNWSDRVLIAALTRLLPTPRRLGLLITPATILRWHRQLVARRWTTTPAPPGRPAIPAGLRALVGCRVGSSGRPSTASPFDDLRRGQCASGRLIPRFAR